MIRVLILLSDEGKGSDKGTNKHSGAKKHECHAYSLSGLEMVLVAADDLP